MWIKVCFSEASPQLQVTLTCCENSPTSLPVNATSCQCHFLSTPLPVNITSCQRHFLSTPLPVNVTSWWTEQSNRSLITCFKRTWTRVQFVFCETDLYTGQTSQTHQLITEALLSWNKQNNRTEVDWTEHCHLSVTRKRLHCTVAVSVPDRLISQEVDFITTQAVLKEQSAV